jgi:hypothetical protein
MVQPFDYSLDIQRPDEAFAGGFKMGAAIRDQRDAMQAQETQNQQFVRLQGALGQLGPNATPAEYIGLVNRFPDLQKPLSERYQGFDDARRNALYTTGERAFTLLRANPEGIIDAEAAAASLEQSAAAFDNSNAPDIARVLRDNAKGLRMDPGQARHTLGIMMAANDAARFDKFGKAMGQGELTGFQKDLVAAGIDPASDEGKAASRTYVQNRVDPIITAETPSGRPFNGPRSLYVQQYGQTPTNAQQLPMVTNDAQYAAVPSGARYVDDMGNVRTKR